jgi:hypothetical protein
VSEELRRSEMNVSTGPGTLIEISLHFTASHGDREADQEKTVPKIVPILRDNL